MRHTALFLIGFTVACAGYLYSLRLETRVKKLEKIMLLLSQIKTEIEFTADNIEAIFYSLSQNRELSCLTFISSCRSRLKNGEDFSTAWNASLDRKENTRYLKKDDIALLRSFGESLGKTDFSGQMRNCEMHEKMFRKRLDSASEDKNAFSKPAKITGLLCGAAVMIIFM